MSVSEPRPAAPGRVGNILVWSLIVVLSLLFAALTVYQVLGRDRSVVNEARVKELAKASTPPAHAGGSLDWPQWRGPNRDGVSTETGLLAEWPEDGLRVLWSQKTGVGYSSVTVANGCACTMVQDGDGEAIVCWDAETGVERGRFTYDAKFSHPYGGGPRSTPSLDENRIYAVGATGIMTCLEWSDWRSKQRRGLDAVWTKDLKEEFGSRPLEWGVAFSPLIEKDLVFVMPGGPDGQSLAALNKETGDVVWKAFDDLPSYSSPVAADLAGTRQILFLTEQRLIGVEPATGRLLWDFPWGPTGTHAPTNITTPLVIHTDVGDYVFISSGYDKGCALIKIEKDGDRFRTAQVYHNRNLTSTFATSVRWGDYLYGFDDVFLTCLDWRTGKRQWKERGFGKGSVTIADGRLIILSDDGELALAETNPDEYQEISRFRHSKQPSSWSVPVVANGRLYVRDLSRMVCYDLKKSP